MDWVSRLPYSWCPRDTAAGMTPCLDGLVAGRRRLSQTRGKESVAASRRNGTAGQERAVTDSRGHVSGDRAYHAMGVSASPWRATGQHCQLVRRVDLGRIVAVSNS